MTSQPPFRPHGHPPNDLPDDGPAGSGPVQVRHHTHPEVVKRLRRAEGHLRSVVAMIEAGRPCLDVAQQLHAVEKAVTLAKRSFIHDHLDDCLDRSLGGQAEPRRDAVEEFREITKYL